MLRIPLALIVGKVSRLMQRKTQKIFSKDLQFRMLGQSFMTWKLKKSIDSIKKARKSYKFLSNL